MSLVRVQVAFVVKSAERMFKLHWLRLMMEQQGRRVFFRVRVDQLGTSAQKSTRRGDDALLIASR